MGIIMGKYDLSATERLIMEYLWEYNGTVKIAHLLDAFAAKGKNWKPQTLNTLLFRLNEMGLVVRVRGTVRAAYTKAEYDALVAKDILDFSYGGRLRNFVEALSGGAGITDEVYKELKELIK